MCAIGVRILHHTLGLATERMVIMLLLWLRLQSSMRMPCSQSVMMSIGLGTVHLHVAAEVTLLSCAGPL